MNSYFGIPDLVAFGGRMVFRTIAIAIFLTLPANAQVEEDTQKVEEELEIIDIHNADPEQIALDSYLWLKRPLFVFADTPYDPRFIEQISLLQSLPEELIERDVTIFTDTDPSESSELRNDLRPRGFALILIGKDGSVKLRKPFPWNVRELSRAIDKMPLRQQELRSR